MSEFYVGYLSHAPAGLRRFLSAIVMVLVCAAAILAIVLVVGQNPFPASRFEYHQYKQYEGIVIASPHPTLLTSSGRFLLVSSGKHGAAEQIAGMNLRNVQLSASLIERSGHRMLEVVPGSIHSISDAMAPQAPVSLGSVTVTGEIVDSKCYLGVMNPGNGKVHRSCAARCISGGIPPAVVVRDSSGVSQLLLLTGHHGSRLSRRILDFVAEPVRMSGQLTRAGDIFTLELDENTLQRREARE